MKNPAPTPWQLAGNLKQHIKGVIVWMDPNLVTIGCACSCNVPQWFQWQWLPKAGLCCPLSGYTTLRLRRDKEEIRRLSVIFRNKQILLRNLSFQTQCKGKWNFILFEALYTEEIYYDLLYGIPCYIVVFKQSTYVNIKQLNHVSGTSRLNTFMIVARVNVLKMPVESMREKYQPYLLRNSILC